MLIQGYPVLNVAATTAILVLVAHEVHKITNDLISAISHLIVDPIAGKFQNSKHDQELETKILKSSAMFRFQFSA